MWKLTRKIFLVCFIHVCSNVLFLNSQEIDQPRGPWQLVFKVVSGNWDSATTGHSTFWELFTSTDTYNTETPVPSQRDFSTSSDHYKSETVELWEDGYISVQAIKISLFKNDEEKAYVVFDAIGKTKSTWFKCDNILYSSFTDLPDQTLPAECPGRNVYNGLPLTLMKVSYMMAYCPLTTGWLVIADTDFGFTLCPDYMPAGDSGSKPYFKYSSLPTIADLSTQLETADSLCIFFQVWDLAFKGVEGIKPSAAGLSNLTGLFLTDLTENDNSDLTVRNLQHTQSSLIFKSDVINLWDTYFIDMLTFGMEVTSGERTVFGFPLVDLCSEVKFSMLKSGVEQAFVVFDGSNTDRTSWFSESNILYSSYGSPLNDAALEVCSIEGDSYRNWQIQSVADDTGCSSAEQMGWMLVKEPRNNGTCSWDTSTLKKKPYFLYNTDSSAANPSLFQYADVVAVFVHGWRLVFKVSAGGSVSPMSGIYALWTESGGLNENLTEASTISSPTTFKSSIIDQWTSYYIRAVKIAAYKSGMEVVSAVFDGTGSSDTDWLDCRRLLFTSVTGLTGSAATNNAYTCSMEGESSTFRFFIGKSPDCGTVSASGVFFVVDADSACSSRNDLPQFVYSSTLDTALDDTTESQLADSFAIFVDMTNCYGDTCLNGGTCQDLGGNFRCFCVGSYYGDTCANLDGTYEVWSSWSACSVTCASGTQTRTRTCTGAEGEGVCDGDSSETIVCTLDPCPIDGGFTEWNTWSQCTVTCGTGTRTRSRDCTNPIPQYGGSDCLNPSSDSESCNTNPCPIDGGLSDWSDWSTCSVSCEAGIQSRERTCTNPSPQYGGASCTGETSETRSCDLGPCPIDGGYSEWNEWNVCSKTCGGGERSRTRDCTNPVPQYGGSTCSGDDTETQTCNPDNCPIDGGYSDWSEWNVCSKTCGGGVRSRTRDCTNPVPQYGGSSCSGDDTETQTCNSDNCPIDGGYSEWSEWNVCSKTCGSGLRSKTRDCTNPVPQYGGSTCSGDDTETQTCNPDNCPIDGGYSNWSEWNVCSKTCGGGVRSRTRDCTNPVPQYGGSSCSGDDTETQTCNSDNCPIDGGYSEWSEWNVCSKTCGGGEQTRTRDCTNPVPQYGGSSCSGDDTETQTCNSDNCPIDGGYSEWSEWNVCSKTCGGGVRSRTHDCTNPAPQYGGSSCSGDYTETQTCNSDNCPIDGGYSEWSEWNVCSKTCGGGVLSRTRDCTNPVPQYGGSTCSGDDTETQTCNSDNCPIDGGYSEWSEWNVCSKTCGGGVLSRTRECTNPAPQYGGSSCSGDDTETQTCNSDNCPIDGGYSEWSEWNVCSKTCGSGVRSRTRDCTNPVPQYGGSTCSGDDTETQTCNPDNCPIDGGYSDWSEWNVCSKTCGGGVRSRTRDCTNPVPQYGGSSCSGDDTETHTCNSDNCPIDGGYSEWSEWNVCSKTCGGGVRSRTRECTNPVPQYGGSSCSGDDTETQTCNSENCPIDGGYSEWSEWNVCSKTCGGGVRSRTRDCTNPVPQYGGSACSGDATETQTCNSDNCPIDGGYSEWSEWNVCSKTCGGGVRSRTRECTNPVPQYGGSSCSGDDTETQTCNSENCPIDGGYSEWSEWNVCSKTCGGGVRSRTRDCTNPVPQYGGSACSGDATETQTCNSDNCPIDGGYSDWSEWNVCSETCGGGVRSRTRECTNPLPQYGGSLCSGDDTETQTCYSENCPIDGGYSEWSEWNVCSKTCGGGVRSRTRDCTNPVPQYGGSACSGDDTETQTCNSDNCPIDGGYSDWSEWNVCSKTCGSGVRSRTRDCTNPVPQYGGSSCSGFNTETQTCNSNNCPIDGGYSEWSEWNVCSETCGGGVRSRTRECTNPLPQYGGSTCSGDDTETQTCNSDNCPIDGGYSEWSEWNVCSKTCGGGVRSRTRDCTNPVPQYGGSTCSGDDTETQTCNSDNCPIDGGYSEWSEWNVCSKTCGGGLRSRTRDCTNPVPQYGGSTCSGDDIETQTCNSDNCPIDGGYSEWSEWNVCSKTCGGGVRSRSRDCTNPVPQYGGSSCSGEDTETQTCNSDNCPIDGGFSEWSEWNVCSKTCSGGEQTRTRDCTNPVPQYGGSSCSGDDTETQTCNSDNCPIDGGYSEWSEWNVCSKTCGGGVRSRTRDCTNPVPQYGGSSCSGFDTETQTCNSDNCPIDGGYSEWSEWDTCTVTCGTGEHFRFRECTVPPPQFGGISCYGDYIESQACFTEHCPVDGGFSEWSVWSTCSVSCGEGDTFRTRECTNPIPQHGGEPCTGNYIESIICTKESCPVDGGFTAWSEWSTCSVSCGNGESYRTRDCTNPAPEHGGATCAGDDTETIACYAEECPEPAVDGGFTEWSDWSECTVTCGGGQQTRVRSCTNPEPQNGGSDCSGDTEESQGCGLESCPVDGGFTEWGSWSVCSVTCGDGEQTRTRTCTNPVPQLGGKDCEGDTEEIQTCSSGDCPVNGGFTDWSSWGDCSVTCGEGVQTRTRNCSNPAPLNGGEDCVGDSEESQACDQGPCSVDGYLTEWEEWSTCSASCNGGTRERHRTCVEPLDGGNPCVGAIQQSEFCNTQICPLDGTWSEWTEWENCSEVCGGGTRFRSRTCIGPLHGGEECTGNTQENETCNEEPCPIDGYWSDWNEWSTCTLTCNTGTRERTRVCTGQQYGGQTCPGATSQSEFCNSEPCPVDGEWLGWSEWSPCTSSCGGGSRNRSRVCVEPLYGGSDCEGEHVQTETCNNASCPVDGYWLEWSKWGSCSVSCADGVRNRSRTCIEPLHGGFECIGEKSQYIPCDNGPCPVDGYWSEWSAWTKCSKTCGGGLRNKTRACIEPLYGGRACEGEASETDTCNIDACPIDGEWSDWTPWSTCTATCGGGTRKKNRTCSEPKYGGKYCDGEEAETDMCNVDPCSVNGYWGEWSDWSECTVSCERGSRDRFRACVEPKFGGSACEGVDEESEECNSHMCPVDGEWTTWSDWSQCSSTCNGGARNRSRLCTIPEFGGKNCTGHKIEIQICGIEACPSVDGGWSTWTAWSACSMTCGFAERLRNRTCTNPSPQWGGRYCEGVHIQSDSCKENDCPVDGGWTEWTDWSPCFNMTVNNVSSPKCGRGFKQRNRSCDNPTPQFDGSECLGNATEVKTCNIPCHRVTCSKENPEQCQIIFEYIPENRGSKKTVSCFAGLLFVLFFIIRLLIST